MLTYVYPKNKGTNKLFIRNRNMNSLVAMYIGQETIFHKNMPETPFLSKLYIKDSIYSLDIY